MPGSDAAPLPKAASIAWILLGVLLAILVCSSWITPDVYYHLSLGRRIVESGHPQPADDVIAQQPGFVNIYWIWQVLTYGLHALGGPAALTGLLVALWLATTALWADTAGLFRRPALGLPLGLLGLLVLQSRLEPRPEALSYLLLALQIRWLTRWNFASRSGAPVRAALFFATTALWTNVHGYFALAPLLVLARSLSAWSARASRHETRPLLWLLVVTIAATFVSPFGGGAWKGVLVLWQFLGAMRHEVAEFGPPSGPFLSVWTVWIFWIAWAATAAALGVLGSRRRVSLFAAALAVAALYLSAAAARNIPLLLLLSAPLWERGVRAAPSWRSVRASAIVVGLLALALSGAVVRGDFHGSLRAETRFGIGPARHAYAGRAAEYLERIAFRGTLFNSAADGGYLEFRLRDVRPYLDSRYTDVGIVREYFRALRDPVAFAGLDERHRFDGVLLKVADSAPLVQALLPDPTWRLAWADLHRALFLRADGSWRDAPVEAASLYRGEDLGERLHGNAAIQWVSIFRGLGRRDLLLGALADFGRAERVPSPLLQAVLEYAVRTRDDELRARAAALRPRMVALRTEDRDAVDRLLRVPLP